jgi:hypothetical protein
MKKVILIAVTSLLSLNLLAADQTVSASDQKWLNAVQKMLADGEHEISTPVEARTHLLADWAKKNGYVMQVAKTESSFRINLSKSVVKN